MHTQNNGYMKTSSKYDQSGTEPSFLPPQGRLLHVLLLTEQTWTCVAPDVASRSRLTIPFPKSFPKDITCL